MVGTCLKRNPFESRCLDRYLLHSLTASHAACEGHEIHKRTLDCIGREFRRQVQNLDYVGRHACSNQGECKSLGYERGLRGRFEDYGISCDDRREDGVDRDQVREAKEWLLRSKTTNGNTNFQGAITSTTPRGARRMNRLKPGLSVSSSPTSARAVCAIESMY